MYISSNYTWCKELQFTHFLSHRFLKYVMVSHYIHTDDTKNRQ